MKSASLFKLSLIGVAVVLGVFLREPLVSIFKRPPEPDPPPIVKLPPAKASPDASRRIGIDRVKKTLEWADDEGKKSIDEHLRSIDVFFAETKTRTPGFAAAILSWGSKWRLMFDKVPYTKGDRHAIFLRETFNSHLFTPEQLTQVLQQVTKNYIDAETGVENLMLIKIREDVSDLPPALFPVCETMDAIKVAYQGMLVEQSGRVSAELKADLTTQAVSAVVGEVVTMVAIKLGVSAGILAVGAGSSPETVGIGLVVGLAVDQVVSWIYNWWWDPIGDVTN